MLFNSWTFLVFFLSVYLVDIDVITSRECARRLQADYYPIRTSQSSVLPTNILISAVEERQALVSRRLHALADVNTAPVSPGPDDAEEALRILMVRHWPKGEGNRALSCLASIELVSSARWRFWDAWNNVFEKLDSLQLSADEHKWFLSRYFRVLDTLPGTEPLTTEAVSSHGGNEADP